MRLENKVIGITGAASGIGRATALRMAGEGAWLALSDRDLQGAHAVAQEIAAGGGKAEAWQLNVTDRAQVEKVIPQMAARWGKLDVWVSNAGVSSMNRFVDLTEEEWDLNMDVNAKGEFLCGQVVARILLQQDVDAQSGLRGKIINMASTAGRSGNTPFLAHYIASKFAVVGLTQAMACELAPSITVNAVCPGFVSTSMQEREVSWEAKLRGISPEEVRQLYVRATPQGRLETADDVAKIVCMLASSDADFVTGECIVVNGGNWMG